MRLCRPAPAAVRGFSELALHRADAAEQTAVEGVEIVAGRKEHEAAGHPDGDADRAAVELDCEALAWHLNFSNARRRASAGAAARCPSDGLCGKRSREAATLCLVGRPRASPCRAHAAAQ